MRARQLLDRTAVVFEEADVRQRPLIHVSDAPDGRIYISVTPGTKATLVLRSISGARWHAREERWSLPAKAEAVLCKLFPNHELTVEPGLVQTKIKSGSSNRPSGHDAIAEAGGEGQNPSARSDRNTMHPDVACV